MGAEKKVKRMEEEYKRSLAEHEQKLQAEKLRRQAKLDARREELKSRRKRRNAEKGGMQRRQQLKMESVPEAEHVGNAEVLTLGSPPPKRAPAAPPLGQLRPRGKKLAPIPAPPPKNP